MTNERGAVFISGTGSNLAALMDLPAINVSLVVTSKPTAAGAGKARRRGVPVIVFHDWESLQKELIRCQITYIFLAGFMKIIPESFLKNWTGRIWNIHPSLLPSYPGLNSIERAYVDRAALGCTLHEVTPQVDGGKIIVQKQTSLSENLISSEFLVHLAEHRTVRKGVVCLLKKA